jgi:hypothetical protein
LKEHARIPEAGNTDLKFREEKMVHDETKTLDKADPKLHEKMDETKIQTAVQKWLSGDDELHETKIASGDEDRTAVQKWVSGDDELHETTIASGDEDRTAVKKWLKIPKPPATPPPGNYPAAASSTSSSTGFRQVNPKTFFLQPRAAESKTPETEFWKPTSTLEEC